MTVLPSATRLGRERVSCGLRVTSRCQCGEIKHLAASKVYVAGVKQVSRVFQAALPRSVQEGEEYGVTGDAAGEGVVKLNERCDADRSCGRLLHRMLALHTCGCSCNQRHQCCAAFRHSGRVAKVPDGVGRNHGEWQRRAEIIDGQEPFV